MSSTSHLRSVRSLAVLVAIALCTACRDNPTQPKAPNYDGSWVGATSDGRSITFSVSGTTITQLSVGFRLSGSCYTTGVTINYVPGTIATISGRGFQVLARDLTVNGSFSSDIAASGSGNMTVSNAGPATCTSSGAHTWTAHKQ